MSQQEFPPLSEEQIAHFLAHGHVVIHDCFPRAFAEDWTANAFRRLEYDPGDPSTWQQEIVHMPATRRVSMPEIAPKAWQAACALLGGEERVSPCTWGDGMIVNFRKGRGPALAAALRLGRRLAQGRRLFPPLPGQPRAGPAHHRDLVRHRAAGRRHLRRRRLGRAGRPLAGLITRKASRRRVRPKRLSAPWSISAMTSSSLPGKIGDVVLIHPFLLHASSQNHSGKARFITNPPISLKEPMQFDREDPADFSPVERAVLLGLGVERLDFQPAAPRERIVSEGMKRKQKMLEEEQARLAAAGH